MKLGRCQIAGFGRLRELECRFGPRLNVVFAENEGGKSTLQRCLVGLLVGQWRADLTTQRRADSWVEKYKPWDGAAYGGALWCLLANGRELEVRRKFGRDEEALEIRSATGEDITGQYDTRKNGDVLFAERHLGLPKELFESLAVIRETALAELEGRETLRERLTNLAQAGSEKVSVRRGLRALADALDAIGSERAPTKPYRLSKDRLAQLEEEAQLLAARHEEYHEWLQERRRLAEEVRSLEAELRRAACSTAVARRHESQQRMRALEELEGEILQLAAEIDALGADDSFPLQHLEELDQLAGFEAATAKSLQGTRDELGHARARLRDAREPLSALEPYAQLRSRIDEEMVTRWFMQYMNLSPQREAEQKKLQGLDAEASALKGELGKLPGVVAESEEDWERRARETAERKDLLNRDSVALSEEIGARRETAAALRGRVTRNRIYAAGAALGVLAAGILAFALDIREAAGMAAMGFAALFAGVALACFRAASGRSREAASLDGQIAGMEGRRDRLKAEVGQVEEALARIVSGAGYENTEGFLQAARQAGLLKARLRVLEERSAEAREKRNSTEAELAAVQEHLKGSFEAVGLVFSPADLKEKVDLLRDNLRRLSAIERDIESMNSQCLTLSAREQSLAADLERIGSRLQEILAEAGVESAGEFRKAASLCRRARELKQKRSFRQKEFDRLRDGASLEDLRRRLADLERVKTEACVGIPESIQTAEGPEAGERRLPLTPGLLEAEEGERRLQGRLAEAREEYARIGERIERAFHNLRASAEVEEDIEAERRELARHTLNRRALEQAREIIETLLREQQEDTAPRLNQAVESRFLRLCGGRYHEAKIDPDFGIWLREERTGELRGAESLSRGTQDQLYFALRFGILDMIGRKEEPCPCLLDEPFAAYDRPRLEEVFRILQEEARSRQLILFTCREDVRDLAVARSAELIFLPRADP